MVSLWDQMRTPQFDKFAGSKFGRAQRGPGGRRKPSAGVGHREVPHNLSRRASILKWNDAMSAMSAPHVSKQYFFNLARQILNEFGTFWLVPVISFPRMLNPLEQERGLHFPMNENGPN